MEDMSYWKEVWERKGNTPSDTLEEFDGYEDTCADVHEIADKITNAINITENDTILEVACGAGGLAQYLKYKQYVGVDYSSSLVKKHIEILKNSVLEGEANDLIFKDKSFDIVICYGAFHYFPNMKYAKQAISEFERVARKAIFIGDLPVSSHRDTHLLYKKEDFKDWTIIDGYYNPCRFNIYKTL